VNNPVGVNKPVTVNRPVTVNKASSPGFERAAT